MIIVVAHTKGGVGKSLISWHLAVEIGKKAKLVDLDFQKTLVFANSLREQNGQKPLMIDSVNSEDELINSLEDDNFKYTIVDVGGFDSDLNRMAIYAADLVIVPASEKITELAGLSRFEQIVKDIEEKTEEKINCYVLENNINHNVKNLTLLNEFIENSNIFQKFSTRLCARADYYKALEDGIGVSNLKNSKAKDEIKNLYKEIKRFSDEKEN